MPHSEKSVLVDREIFNLNSRSVRQQEESRLSSWAYLCWGFIAACRTCGSVHRLVHIPIRIFLTVSGEWCGRAIEKRNLNCANMHIKRYREERRKLR